MTRAKCVFGIYLTVLTFCLAVMMANAVAMPLCEEDDPSCVILAVSGTSKTGITAGGTYTRGDPAAGTIQITISVTVGGKTYGPYVATLFSSTGVWVASVPAGKLPAGQAVVDATLVFTRVGCACGPHEVESQPVDYYIQ